MSRARPRTRATAQDLRELCRVDGTGRTAILTLPVRSDYRLQIRPAFAPLLDSILGGGCRGRRADLAVSQLLRLVDGGLLDI